VRTARALAAAGLLAAVPASAEKRALAPGERIDLNRATAADLMRLPGIGRGRAKAILEHRTRQPFRSPEEVIRVKGVSARWYAKVKGHLSTSAPPSAPAAAPPRAPASRPASAPLAPLEGKPARPRSPPGGAP
jgi:competence protein ComEA